MLNTQGHKLPQSLLKSPVRQSNSFSSTPDLEDGASSPTSRKRKRADIDGEIQLGDPFFVRTHPSLPSPKSQSLVPSLLLPRSCLPLAYVGSIEEVEDGSGPRLFSGNIEVLERDVLENQLPQPTVLIGQSLGDSRLWAVERVQHGIYALCKLCQWVTLNSLGRLQALPWDNGQRQESPHSKIDKYSTEDWWHTAAIRSVFEAEEGMSNAANSKKTCPISLCLQRPVQSVPIKSLRPQGTLSTGAMDAENALDMMVEEVSQMPDEILNMVRYQYQEALYASKTPLAYFAKGPLSRARATFHSYDGSLCDQSLLSQFLRSRILSLTTMDTKYRETLPNLIRDLPSGTFSDDECASMITAISKKARKSKKTKVGKNGLHAGEEVDITRWWIGRDMSFATSDSPGAREDAVKTALLEQRARETQLQIILVLETLALEASATEPAADPTSLKDLKKRDEDSQRKPKKPRKLQDLDTLLDLLADRLCIWQDMSIDQAKSSSADKRPSSEHGAKVPIEAARNDCLRQFCVDVVLPFYGARLTKLTTLLCNKLGGPKQPSPKRPALPKAATSYSSQRLDASLQRENTRKPRRTLERVLTDERSSSQRPPPSLSRSATDPVLPQLKRENSDTSLSAIPLNRVAMHKRYSQREVDLHAASQANESKLKQKAKVDQELQSAIAALKRPNPRMAVKELMEDAERRVARSHSRKSKNPVRNPFAQGIQVMATPSRNRYNNNVTGLPRLPGSHLAGTTEPVSEIPPSSISKISDSIRKTRGPPILAMGNSRPHCGDGVPNVEQTPTRGPSKLLGRPTSQCTNVVINERSAAPYLGPTRSKPSHSAPDTSPSRPLSSRRHQNVQDTPSKARAAHHTEGCSDDAIQETPDKVHLPTANSIVTFSTAVLSSSAKQEKSIYATLGWDNDDVDELL